MVKKQLVKLEELCSFRRHRSRLLVKYLRNSVKYENAVALANGGAHALTHYKLTALFKEAG